MPERLQAPGMIYDLPNEDYHANKEYHSFSNVKMMMKSPELFKKHIDGLLPEEHKDAWLIGEAVHTAVLEPENLWQYYFADSSYKGSTKAGKEIKAKCEAAGQKLLNASNSATYHHCVGALTAHPAIELFRVGDPEVTFRVSSDQLNLQCRTDWICHSAPSGLEAFGIKEGERYVADLKTTRSLDDWLEEFRWKNPLTNDLFYAGQESFYSPIIDSVLTAAGHGLIDRWVFVVVEKEEPFRVAVIRTPEHVLEWAEATVNAALIKLIERTKSNQWTDERLSGVFEPTIREAY